jgi:hypothetical protein
VRGQPTTGLLRQPKGPVAQGEWDGAWHGEHEQIAEPNRLPSIAINALQTMITVKTGASVCGRLLAQTQVALQKGSVTNVR